MHHVSACANIALVKYWGKRDARLNLPAAGSLSLTLAALRTDTEIELVDGPTDRLELDGREVSGRPLERMTRLFDLVRRPDEPRARVRSRSSFPAASGLASSASGFAALAVAAAAAYGRALGPAELSVLARRGSGSAARSIFGGFAKMARGERPDGADAFASPVESRLELEAAIAVVRAGPRAVSSTDGMERTEATSPYHAAWIAQVERDLADATAALATGDFERLADVTEGSCLAMHADAMAARPGIVYFRPVTLWAIEQIRELRRGGTPVMFTVDAGPHVVAFTTPGHAEAVAARLMSHGDVDRVLTSRAGPGAHVVEAR